MRFFAKFTSNHSAKVTDTTNIFREDDYYTAMMVCNSIIRHLHSSKQLGDINDDDADDADANDDDTQLGVKYLQN